MEAHKILIFLVVLIQSIQGNHKDCTNTEKCNCFDSFEYEFQCPPDKLNVVIHTVPNKYMKIDCDNMTQFDLEIFPDVNIGDIDIFSMRFCPLPNVSFDTTLEKFNIKTVKSMQLEDLSFYKNMTARTLSKELFAGLSTLEKLSISFSPVNLDTGVLENLPNLVQLFLDNNEIHEIGYIFNNTQQLRVLHLSRNSIRHLPEGLFKNLSNLQQLHLWENKLSSLGEKLFVGLRQLKSLELSRNNIQNLDKNTFSELVELVDISLRANNLTDFSSDIFRYNKALKSIRIGNNPNLDILDYAFANLTALSNINIDNSNLKTMPGNIFQGSNNLLEISLKNNDLQQLHMDIFKDLIKLRKLDLSANNISSLPKEIFSSLQKIEEINLNNNNLIKITSELFEHTSSLRKLFLKSNKITTVSLNAFRALRKLTYLDLSYNLFTLNYNSGILEGVNPFSACEKIETLNLSHNLIDEFPEGIMDTKVHLKSLDLDYNKLENLRVASLIKVSNHEVEVYLINNNITILDFNDIRIYAKYNEQKYDAMNNNESSTVLYISDNPITCNCYNFDLIQYKEDEINPVIKTLINIKTDNILCSSPKEFQHIQLNEIKPRQVTCSLTDEECPRQCGCDWRPYDQTAVVDCSYRNLSEIPRINLKDRSKVEVNLQGNSLKKGPHEGLGYENVTRLFLSNNQIANLSWIPSKIEVLWLNSNLLSHIGDTVIKILNESSIENLTLYENPWACGCSATSLQKYIRNNYNKVNTNEVRCNSTADLLIDKELCKSRALIIMAILTPLLVLFFATALLAALYYRYQQEIKVWLYAKNLCLWFVTEEELDKEKAYDIFISYSHIDEEFVIQNLLPVLESGPNPFKCCIHVRDWVPGEFITTQIANSVLDSKRTLVVLSDSFLESVWGKMEFRAAHTQAINEGRARVVVVKYGNLTEEKLDDELKTYLKTNTYVEWGDPWFWNKLKYALPHGKQNKFYNTNQKHANVMLKIDDKFELVTSAPTLNTQSTPPVISLDPCLLKDHPLRFNPSMHAETPPAEAPLMIKR